MLWYLAVHGSQQAPPGRRQLALQHQHRGSEEGDVGAELGVCGVRHHLREGGLDEADVAVLHADDAERQEAAHRGRRQLAGLE